MLTQKEILVLELRQKGLTQVEVAIKLNITQSAVSSFEKNAHNKIMQAREIIRFVDSQISTKKIKKW